MRDLMAHRGPDGAGLWRSPAGDAVLAHRRLAVVDLSPAGGQPMVDGACVLVYNGELYNDAEIRRSLAREGVAFRSACDTETVLKALMQWGSDALQRFRGMYALGFLDSGTRTLLIARDPLGVKPLYFWRGKAGGVEQVVFASEAPAILAHPDIPVRPDFITVSGYLTTIRTTLGERTLFEGVRTLVPGEWRRFDLARSDLPDRAGCVPITAHPVPVAEPAAALRESLRESVHAHLRADVPTCCLLSGGLDSAAIAALAKERVPDLATYCSGASEPGSDIEYAKRAARAIGTRHATAAVTKDLFLARWPEMIERTGLPLSTPNEVAINEVARRLRADGMVVTLSGEGADEILGGYELPMRDALAYVRSDGGDPGGHQVDAGAWVPTSAKPGLLTDKAWQAAARDEVLYATYRTEFERARSEGGFGQDEGDRLGDHLRLLRRVNLAGLLLRLDSASMLESVESRTPFADATIAGFCESLPMSDKFVLHESGRSETKRVLRLAMAGFVPEECIRRPKASFPLPFQSWLPARSAIVGESAMLREIFVPPALAAVVEAPDRLWNLAWPVLNLAWWGRRWWG